MVGYADGREERRKKKMLESKHMVIVSSHLYADDTQAYLHGLVNCVSQSLTINEIVILAHYGL